MLIANKHFLLVCSSLYRLKLPRFLVEQSQSIILLSMVLNINILLLRTVISLGVTGQEMCSFSLLHEFTWTCPLLSSPLSLPSPSSSSSLLSFSKHLQYVSLFAKNFVWFHLIWILWESLCFMQCYNEKTDTSERLNNLLKITAKKWPSWNWKWHVRDP